MTFSPEQGGQLGFRNLKISKPQDLDDIGILEVQRDPELFQYIVICHQYLRDIL